jgi:hypothetical protein
VSTSGNADHVEWAVEGSHWDLPDEVAVLVAPPVVVSAQATDRVSGSAVARFLLPAPPRPRRFLVGGRAGE